MLLISVLVDLRSALTGVVNTVGTYISDDGDWLERAAAPEATSRLLGGPAMRMRFATQSDILATNDDVVEMDPTEAVDRENEALSAEPEALTEALTATLKPAEGEEPVTGGL